MRYQADSNELYKYIGERLKHYRQLNNERIEDIAKKLKRSRYFVLDAERARFRIPLDKLYEYCEILDIDIWDVLPKYRPNSVRETIKGIENI